MHVATDGTGLPVRFEVGPGQESDIGRAGDLIKDLNAEAVLADRGYDADHFIETIRETGAEPVIPPRKNRKLMREYDKEVYRERNQVERFFGRLKEFRRVATRYDKLLQNFMGFLKFAAILVSIR